MDDGILSPLATENKTTLAFSVLRTLKNLALVFQCCCFIRSIK